MQRRGWRSDERPWTVAWRPRRESNPHLALRRRSFYPLNYGGTGSGHCSLRAYLDSSRIASSRPLSVSGYIRPPMSCWMTLMLWRYCHTP
jgi:hypothetical protein